MRDRERYRKSQNEMGKFERNLKADEGGRKEKEKRKRKNL